MKLPKRLKCGIIIKHKRSCNMYKTRYKDKSPLDTVNYIKRILDKLGVRIEETTGESSYGTYWVHLKGYYKKALVGISNGKGSTKEFALASGYAEFMERIQNQLQSNSIAPLSTDFFSGNNKFRFMAHQNEKYLSAEEVINSNGDIINSFLDFYGRNYYYNILKFHEEKIFNKRGLVCVPFNKLNDHSYVEYIPQIIRISVLTSNGMCAGNTKEEALTQGLSEIFERYVQLQIANHDIEVPTIPNEDIKYINKEIYNIIKNIEKNNKEYKITIKECSLGCDFPVIAVILMNKKTKKYFVNFAASPIFDIALERCLTEIFQGADIEFLEKNSLSPFLYFDEQDANRENNFQLMITGVGTYTNRFMLGNNYNYTIKHFSDKKTNAEFLDYYLQLCKKNNATIYIADLTHLGFPTYHIYIPGFSFLDSDFSVCQAEEDVLDALYFLKEKTLKDYKNNINQIASAHKTIERSNNFLLKRFIVRVSLTTKRVKYEYLEEHIFYTYLKFATFLCIKNYTLAIGPLEEYINCLQQYIDTKKLKDEKLIRHFSIMNLLRTFLSFAIRHQEHQLFESNIFTEEEKKLFHSVINSGEEIKKVLFENDIILDKEATNDLIEYCIKYSNFEPLNEP